MRVGEKVLIMGKTPLKGKLARITFKTGEQLKVVLDGDPDNEIWINESLVRRVQQKGMFQPIEEKEAVRIVDSKGNIRLKEHLGKAGYVNWSDGHQMTVNIDEPSVTYCESGDVRLIPKQKTAWVIFKDKVIRKRLTRALIKNGTVRWVTPENYRVSDPLVYDDFTKALDHLRNKVEYKEILEVEYD